MKIKKQTTKVLFAVIMLLSLMTAMLAPNTIVASAEGAFDYEPYRVLNGQEVAIGSVSNVSINLNGGDIFNTIYNNYNGVDFTQTSYSMTIDQHKNFKIHIGGYLIEFEETENSTLRFTRSYIDTYNYNHILNASNYNVKIIKYFDFNYYESAPRFELHLNYEPGTVQTSKEYVKSNIFDLFTTLAVDNNLSYIYNLNETEDIITYFEIYKDLPAIEYFDFLRIGDIAEDPIHEDPPAEEPITEDPPEDDPIIEEPPVEDPVTEDPIVEDSNLKPITWEWFRQLVAHFYSTNTSLKIGITAFVLLVLTLMLKRKIKKN